MRKWLLTIGTVCASLTFWGLVFLPLAMHLSGLYNHWYLISPGLCFLWKIASIEDPMFW